MTRTRLLAGVAVLTVMAMPAARAGSLYAFGDSLSDNGNMYSVFNIQPTEGNATIPLSSTPGGTGSYGGRYSNGPVWVENLGAMIGRNFSPGNDYAYGGAFTGDVTILGTDYGDNLADAAYIAAMEKAGAKPGTFPTPPGINDEIAQFAKAGGSFGASDVVTLWGGANNYFQYSDVLTSIMQPGEVAALLQSSPAAATAYAAALQAKASAAQAVQAAEGAFLQTGGTTAQLTALMQGGGIKALVTADPAALTAYTSTLQSTAGNQTEAASAAVQAFLAPGIATTLTQLSQDTDQLINLGARMLIVPNLPNLGMTPAYATSSPTIANGISAGHNAALPALMEGLHESTGANIIVLNTALLLNNVAANPTLYGFNPATIQQECWNQTSCAGYLFWNDVHPTAQAQYMIAEYAARSLQGYESLTVPARLGSDAAQNFTSLLDGRLDALQNGANGVSYDLGSVNGGMSDPNHKLSLFLTSGGQFGTQHTKDFALGYSYHSVITAMGADYRWSQHFVSGLAVGYNDSHADVKTGGTVKDQGVVLGVYALATEGDAYAKLTGGYDHDNYKTDRAGVINSITSKPSGDSWSTSALIGLNFHPQPNVILGPDAGLAYTSSSLGAYTETGDSVLTQSVDNQRFQQLIGSAGLHTSTDLTLDNVALAPYASASAEFLMSGTGRHFSSSYTAEPGVTLTSVYPTTSGSWALFSAGMNAALNQQLSADLNVSTTAFKEDGNTVQIGGNLSWKF